MGVEREGQSPPKKVAKKAGKKAAENGREPIQGDIAPETLADLAIKLVQLKNGGVANSNHELSRRVSDPEFQDALKAAQNLLLAASGKTDEDVHAYQLFSSVDGLMTFDEIADRFKEFDWKKLTVRNTVETLMGDLVCSVELAVQKEIERYDKLASVRQRYPGGVHYLSARVKRHICRMITCTGLGDLFAGEKKAADAMGQFFQRLMENDVPGDWETILEEERSSLGGYESFIQYVCDGLTYEQFMKDPPHVRMDLERLGCLVFFLEELGNKEEKDYPRAKVDLDSLQRLVVGRDDVPEQTMSDLRACLVELGKEEPETAQVKQLASSAGGSLNEVWEHWYLIRLASAQKPTKFIKQLERLVSEHAKTDDIPGARFEQLLELLGRVGDVAAGTDEPVSAEAIRKLLEELETEISNKDLLALAGVNARHFDGLVSDEMKRIAVGLKKGLRMKKPLKKHMMQSLRELLNELRPYSGDRKCRPYELLLFAAQNDLEQERLVRRRSSLNSSMMHHPVSSSSASILDVHGGAPW